jgi:chromosome segregation ATPase
MMSPAALLLGALALGAAVAEKDRGSALRGTQEDALASLSQKELNDNREVTKVVRLLETMLKTSKAEGDMERELFAKHKCYCDDNEAAKTARIEELDTEIQMLAAAIEEIQAKTSLLSEEAADLKKRMEDNELQRQKLTSIRAQENQAFLDRSAELKSMKSDLKDALDILSEIGADQAFAAQGHTQQMAGYTLAQVQRALKQASIAAASLGSEKRAAKLSGFLQAAAKGKGPFTATYSTQSGEIWGILADMRDNAIKELEEITAKEAAALEAYNKITASLLEEYNDMDSRSQMVQGDLSGLDSDQEEKKSLKEACETEKAEAEAFLAQLRDLCSEKAAQYEKRVQLRSNEETAIAQAIAILNSDMAFEAFGKVAATKEGRPASFLQLKGNHKGNVVIGTAAMRKRADAMLRSAAQSQHSLKAAKIASLLEAENPFTTVLEAIDQMLSVISEEGEMDKEKKQWCDTERKQKNKALDKTQAEIVALNTRIGELEANIDGLKTDIKNTEDSLTANVESQTSQTADRKEMNLAYQKNVENLVAAEDLLKKAVVVLKAYYEDALTAGAAGTGLLQKGQEDPAPPATWSEYTGQSDKGNDAVSMLEFILKNTKAEETEAHSAEDEDQKAYEEEMTSLKAEEATLQETLSTKQVELTTAEEELLCKKKDLKTMLELEAEIKAYLKQIKPGCDFMDQNIALREQSRKEERDALKGAADLLRETPAYKEAMSKAHDEALGACKDTCVEHGEDHVECLACLAKVSVPGYCAGHKLALGCGPVLS